ncbi:MAG TPA: Rieske 2Fe-2S domain-containing protein [Trebonia sp.]|jgi:phenylpropionate dioxygenase-like ring-hydroxylating dioxygenase large terminal subunit
MLSAADNELLTRVGPGTPMGRFMREYWIPAMLSSELPGPDSDPVRVMLLGEKLIAFRDTDGKVGLFDHRCPHRGGELFYGRNEECGLRCVYHGWKFDVTGACVDMPNEPPTSDFKRKIRAVAYPTIERGGLVWAYMGPRETPPPLPDLAANMTEGAQLFAFSAEANWLQILEGDLDTTHASFLHYGGLKAEDQPEGTFSRYQLENRWAELQVIDTEAGAAYAAKRPGSPGHTYWRIAQWCFPFYAFPPSGVLGLKNNNLCRVPMDDTHTMYYRMYIRYHNDAAGAEPSRPKLRPNTTDWYGRFRPEQNKANDFLINREVQRRNEGKEGYSGIPVVQMQDAAVQTTADEIMDRSIEHLGTTDAMVIRMRRRLLAAVRDYVNNGVTPPGVDEPEGYRVRAGGIELPEGEDWVERTQDLRSAFVDAGELNESLNGPL